MPKSLRSVSRAGVVLMALAFSAGCSRPQSGHARTHGSGGNNDSSASSFAFFGGLMGIFAETPQAPTEARACSDKDLTEPTTPTDKPSGVSAGAPGTLTIR